MTDYYRKIQETFPEMPYSAVRVLGQVMRNLQDKIDTLTKELREKEKEVNRMYDKLVDLNIELRTLKREMNENTDDSDTERDRS